ncbi:hypothetical protein BURC_02019 [Burkholderiaceae bacterium]|nr:hypothetical protein BURC_02019 [Burkholderiaceae bacterium]
MPQDGGATDAQRLREQLMAPDPMQRAMALHALEIEVERCACSGRATLSQEASKFAARGIPYYALHDPHFQSWVGKAVAYWEHLRAAMARPMVKQVRSRA